MSIHATFGDGASVYNDYNLLVREVSVKWRLTFDGGLAKLNVTHRSIDLK